VLPLTAALPAAAPAFVLPSPADVTVELEDIVDAVNVSRTIKNPWGTILRHRYRPQLIISILIPIFQQVCSNLEVPECVSVHSVKSNRDSLFNDWVSHVVLAFMRAH
jgi:hypothetical protein